AVLPLFSSFSSPLLRPLIATLFPYTTLFRSRGFRRQGKRTHREVVQPYLVLRVSLLPDSTWLGNRSGHQPHLVPSSSAEYSLVLLTLKSMSLERFPDAYPRFP